MGDFGRGDVGDDVLVVLVVDAVVDDVTLVLIFVLVLVDLPSTIESIALLIRGQI